MTFQESPLPSPPDIAQVFDDMAARIRLNESSEFAGAFVIVPPGGGEKALLILDNSQKPEVFWGLLQTTAALALAEIDDRQRQGMAYGRR
jgi:hypothetical protein